MRYWKTVPTYWTIKDMIVSGFNFPHDQVSKWYNEQEVYWGITCPLVDMNFIFECSTRYLTSERTKHEKIKFIFASGHVIFCLLYKHQWKRRDLLCNHNDGDLFTCKTCYLHVWRYEVFARKLTWYFTGVYIIKQN